MTRFKLIPWLAIPALLLIAPVTPTATAATPQASLAEDGLIYLPLDEAPAWLEASGVTRLTTSTVGEVAVAQYGAADFLVANRNRFLAVRFDPPFESPYTITKLSFPSRTQLGTDSTYYLPNPGRRLLWASFRSVRVLGADGSGNMDKTQTLYRTNRYMGSPTGGMNDIALSIPITAPGKTFYAVFEFPTPTSGVADTFPFLYTDLTNTEAGLFANSFASDTSGGTTIPPGVGTITGTTQLVDQNLIASLTCALSSTAPLGAPTGSGLNGRLTQSDFSYTAPANVLADGSAAPTNYLDFTELVRRDPSGWTVVATGGAGVGKITLASLPGSGLQIWGIRAVDKGGAHSVVSNVILTGSATVVGAFAGLGSDGDETNGKMNETEATALTVPVADRAETIWPAGDEDNYWFYARPGDEVTATAAPTAIDFRNDLDAVVQLVDNSGDVLATATAASPGDPASLTFTIPPHGGSNALRRHFVQVVDKSGSVLDPVGAPRVLVPPTYNLSVDVQTPASLQQFGPSDAPVSGLLGQDDFAFANTGANPVRGNATFGFVIPRSAASGASVKLRIYDVRGRMVTTLVNGTRTAGTHFASWSGHDSRGNRVASGPYFARLDAGSWSRVVRIDLVK